MALTATFEADFSKFYDAVEEANVKLKSFASGASEVSTKLSGMYDSFSGRNVIQQATLMTEAIERLGGASQLTDQELARVSQTVGEAVEKMKAMGMDVPQKMQDLATATKGYGAVTDELTKKLTTLALAYVSIDGVVRLATGAFDLFVDAMKASIEAASNAEQAHSQLVGALQAQGTAVPSVIAAYDGYAAALQRTTTYSDDAVTAAEAILVQIGNVMPRDMQAALTATTNLAAGLRIDLGSAATMVAKAAEGQTTALQRAGVVIEATSGKTASFDQVLEGINKRFAGQAELLAGTYQGRLDQLANSWDNVEESIGRLFITNDTLLTVLESVNTLIDTNTGELSQNKEATEAVSAAIILFVKAVDLAVQGIDLMQQSWHEDMKAFEQGALLIAKVTEGFIEFERVANQIESHAPGVIGQEAQDRLKGFDEQLVKVRGRIDELHKDIAGQDESSAKWSATLGTVHTALEGLETKLESTRGKTRELASVQGESAGAWAGHTEAMNQNKAALEAWQKAADHITQLLSGPDALPTEIELMAQAMLHAGASVSEVATYFGVAEISIKQIDDAMKEAEKTAKAHQAALAELASVTQDFHATVAGLDQTMVHSVEAYLAAGVSQKTLADAYNLTAAQVSAINKLYQEEQLQLRQNAQQKAELAKLDAQIQKATGEAANNRYQTEVDNIHAEIEAYRASLEQKKQLTEAANAKLDELEAIRTANVAKRLLEQSSMTEAYYKKLADEAQNSLNFAMAHADQFTQSGMAALQKQSDAAQATYLNWQNAADATLDHVASTAQGVSAKITGAANQAAQAIQSMSGYGGTVSLTAANLPAALAQLGMSGGINMDVLQAIASGQMAVPGKAYTGGSTAVQSAQRSADIATAQMILDYLASHTSSVAVSGARQSGGPVEFGKAYVVGEKGPELFVPGTSGMIGAPGAGGGGLVMQPGAVTINYPLMDNPVALDAIARIVGDAIIKRMTRTGTKV